MFVFIFPCSWAVSTMMTRQNDIPLNEANNNNNNDVDAKTSADGENQAKSSSSSAPAAASTQEGGTKVPALIPVWDVANHANGIITTNFNPIDGQIEGATITDVKKDEQIFIYYGNRNNAELLIHNGYVGCLENHFHCLDFALTAANINQSRLNPYIESIKWFFFHYSFIFVRFLQFCHGR